MIRDHLKSHDKRMKDGRERFSLAKACYTTSYWKYVQGAKVATDTGKLTDVNVEVNRLWGVLTSYLGALYPRANRYVSHFCTQAVLLRLDFTQDTGIRLTGFGSESFHGGRRFSMPMLVMLRTSALEPMFTIDPKMKLRKSTVWKTCREHPELTFWL